MSEINNEKKRESPALIYILLWQEVPPKKLIKLGFSRTTVYACHRKLPAIRKQHQELLNRPCSHQSTSCENSGVSG